MQLVRTASWRALADLDAEGRLSPDAFAQVARVTTEVLSDIGKLDSEEGDGAIKAKDRLVAWLIERGEENE
jgi:hypothetical protein